MDDIAYNTVETDGRSMSIDSSRDRTSSTQSYCSAESDTSFAESKTDDEDNNDNKYSSQRLNLCIPIRTREMTIADSLSKSPTPSKYYFMLQENENMIKSMKK